jgi:hypothetical protein
MSTQSWGADVPVSLPQSLGDQEGLVPMFGFTFTINGLFHDMNDSDLEALATPTYAPISPANTVWGDQNIGGG